MSGKKKELDVLESRGEDEEKVERWESTEMGYGPRMVKNMLVMLIMKKMVLHGGI